MAAAWLTESAVVDAALEIVRRSGVDALSMRALSREWALPWPTTTS